MVLDLCIVLRVLVTAAVECRCYLEKPIKKRESMRRHLKALPHWDMANSVRLLQMIKPVLGADQVCTQMLGLRAYDGLLDLELLPRELFGFLEVVKHQAQSGTSAVSLSQLIRYKSYPGVWRGKGEARTHILQSDSDCKSMVGCIKRSAIFLFTSSASRACC